MKTKMILLAVLTTFVFTASNGSNYMVESINQSIESTPKADSTKPALKETGVQESISLVSYNAEQNDKNGQTIKSNQTTKQKEVLSKKLKSARKYNKVKKTQKKVNVSPTITPQVKVTAKPTQAPKVTVTVKPTQAPKPTIVVTPTQSPKPTTNPQPTKAPAATPTVAPVTPTTAPTATPSQSQENVLDVRGNTIAIGDSKSIVISKYGSPTRMDETEYSYDFMVYADNYSKFMMIAIANDKVVGWYTDSVDFKFGGLTTSSKVTAINSAYQKNLTLNRTLSVTADGLNMTFFMDTLGDSTIDGILVVKSGMTKDSTTQAVLTAWEREVLDLTNSFRARNGLSALIWSNEAANAARLHSKDMANNNYFDHTGLNGSTPGTRMTAQGIDYRSYGENIIGGYGNAMYSSNGWMNSSGHRANLINKTFTHLGVGYVLGGSYRDYGTQNFFSN